MLLIKFLSTPPCLWERDQVNSWFRCILNHKKHLQTWVLYLHFLSFFQYLLKYKNTFFTLLVLCYYVLDSLHLVPDKDFGGVGDIKLFLWLDELLEKDRIKKINISPTSSKGGGEASHEARGSTMARLGGGATPWAPPLSHTKGLVFSLILFP
jgi:hypothetical protein